MDSPGANRSRQVPKLENEERASLLVELPETGAVILSGDACYWQESIDKERPPGVVWNPTLALHSIKKLKTIARLVGGRIFPSHDPVFWNSVKQSPEPYR